MADNQKSNEEFFVERYKCSPADATEEIKAQEWARLIKFGNERGFKPGWKFYAYRETFGEEPPGSNKSGKAPF